MKKVATIFALVLMSSTVFASETLNCSILTKTGVGLGANFDKELFQGSVERGDLLFVKDGKAIKIKNSNMTVELWKAYEGSTMAAASIQDNNIVISMSAVVVVSGADSQKTDATIANKLTRATFMSDTKNLAISCEAQ